MIRFIECCIFLTFLSSLFLSCGFDNRASKNALNIDNYKAIVGKDNSFSTFTTGNEKYENLPKFVNKVISDFLVGESDGYLDVIYKINYDEEIKILVLKATYHSKTIRYYLFAYSEKSKKITLNPPYINGKWMENQEKGFSEENRLLTPPLSFFEDIDNDGDFEVVIKERVHNGNVYNAVVNKYYEVNKDDMSLNMILAIESKYIYIMDNKCIINRQFDNNRLLVYLSCNKSDSKKIGDISIMVKEARYSVENISSEVIKYESVLLTGSGVENEAFLNKGYYSIY